MNDDHSGENQVNDSVRFKSPDKRIYSSKDVCCAKMRLCESKGGEIQKRDRETGLYRERDQVVGVSQILEKQMLHTALPKQ